MKRIASLILLAALLISTPGCLEDDSNSVERLYQSVTNSAYLQGRHDERLSNEQLLTVMASIQRVQGELFTNQMNLNNAQMAIARAIVAARTSARTNSPATNAPVISEPAP